MPQSSICNLSIHPSCPVARAGAHRGASPLHAHFEVVPPIAAPDAGRREADDVALPVLVQDRLEHLAQTAVPARVDLTASGLIGDLLKEREAVAGAPPDAARPTA